MSASRVTNRRLHRQDGMSQSPSSSRVFDLESAVRERYAGAAREREGALCCPTSYDPRLLEALPADVVERDYGCGDPSRHVRSGETVLDLGSGTGKVCFLAAQIVGPSGRVIGVDMNDEMLALARRAAPQVASRIGFANVEFRKGKIQDLALDRDAVDSWLREHPVHTEADLVALEAAMGDLRRSRPLIADGSIDVVVSNCVLNLVTPEHKGQLFRELHRVLKRGGRVVISDIVSDEDVPASLRDDPELWSGCISGAFREDLFLDAFEQAGFYGVTILERQVEPWRVVEGIEFRSVTVAAYKGKEGACLDQKHAVIYRGPWRQVEDDDGHVLRRGVRTAVCEKTFAIYAREPYRAHVDLVEPHVLVPLEEAPPFPCSTTPLVRAPRETKGEEYKLTTEAAPVCKPGSCC
jgi:arsenite methyltransferase